MAKNSAWNNVTHNPTFETLNSDLHTDVVIVGTGIAGLMTAYKLLRHGFGVTVLDDGSENIPSSPPIVPLTSIVSKSYAEIERTRGVEVTRLLAGSQLTAIHAVGEIIQEEGIECNFEYTDSYLILPLRERRSALRDELEATKRAGITDVELISEGFILARTDFGPVLRFPNQAYFHPFKYRLGLARAVESLGGQIYCSTSVKALCPNEHGVLLRLKKGYTVFANNCVLSSPVENNIHPFFNVRKFSCKNYFIGLSLPKGILPKFLAFHACDCCH